MAVPITTWQILEVEVIIFYDVPQAFVPTLQLTLSRCQLLIVTGMEPLIRLQRLSKLAAYANRSLLSTYRDLIPLGG
jgi:hypothetical protein